MARRQDSGSNSSHENQRPNPRNEETVPEFTDNVRGVAEDADAEFDASDDEDDDIDDTEEDEGTY